MPADQNSSECLIPVESHARLNYKSGQGRSISVLYAAIPDKIPFDVRFDFGNGQASTPGAVGGLGYCSSQSNCALYGLQRDN